MGWGESGVGNEGERVGGKDLGGRDVADTGSGVGEDPIPMSEGGVGREAVPVTGRHTRQAPTYTHRHISFMSFTIFSNLTTCLTVFVIPFHSYDSFTRAVVLVMPMC